MVIYEPLETNNQIENIKDYAALIKYLMQNGFAEDEISQAIINKLKGKNVSINKY